MAGEKCGAYAKEIAPPLRCMYCNGEYQPPVPGASKGYCSQLCETDHSKDIEIAHSLNGYT